MNLAKRKTSKGGGRKEHLSNFFRVLLECGQQKKCPLLFLYNVCWLKEDLIHIEGMWVECTHTRTHTHMHIGVLYNSETVCNTVIMNCKLNK